MTCLSCHSMHDYESPSDQVHGATKGDESCLQCHEDMRAEPTAHTRHAADSEGSRCMNCHLPHTTYGLFVAMRAHRVDSPSAQVSAETGRPNACNLCHLDQTLAWTDRKLHEWYGTPLGVFDADERHVAAGVLWALRGDAAQRAVTAWHMGWKPAQEDGGQRLDGRVPVGPADRPLRGCTARVGQRARRGAGLRGRPLRLPRPARGASEGRAARRRGVERAHGPAGAAAGAATGCCSVRTGACAPSPSSACSRAATRHR